jgi:2-dehydropantoate 2-reductase
MKAAVLGPGGVGGLLAALLARSGSSVLVLASQDSAHVIRLESLQFGDFQVEVETATELRDPVDACLVTVKATQLDEAIVRVPADRIGEGLIVPFLNGLEHVEKLRAVYPPVSVVAGTIRVETAKVGPGVIRHTSPFTAVELAASPENRQRVDALAATLKAAGVKVRVREDEAAMLWEKFALLAPLALVTTHERAGAGVVRTKRREDMTAVVAEVAAVAAADGVAIDPNAVVTQIDSLPESMETSMQRDQAAGRALEIDALGGALLRRAARAGVDVPVTARLVADLQSRG